MPTGSRATTRSSSPADGVATLDRRALNRALLARHMLLERRALPAYDTIEHLVGLQAQNPNDPYVGLWTRLEGFRHDELAGLMSERRALRIALMRSTLHTVTDRDALRLRPLMASVLDRNMRGAFGKHLAGLDPQEIASAGRALVEERAMTFSELGELLGERWPDRNTDALAQAVRAWVPLAQVTPRGIWGRSGQVMHTSLEAWVGRELEPEPSIDDMVLRYLAAYGPASVKDVQTWSGLTRLREVLERLRSRLVIFRDEKGGELFDLPDAPRPDAETPAPPRFLPVYDNLFLSHADRSRIMDDSQREHVWMENGYTWTFLLDGFIAGTWKIERERKSAILRIRSIGKLAKRDRAALAAEGEALLGFVAGEATTHDIRFHEPE